MKKILVVEDIYEHQRIIELFLRNKYDLLFSKSCNDAIKILENQHIELILLDLSLDGELDGLDLVNFVRNKSDNNDIPIIAVTAHVLLSEKELAFKAGCNSYLTKPVQHVALLATIKSFLD